MRPAVKCLLPNCKTWKRDLGSLDVVDHFRTDHHVQIVENLSEKTILKVKFVPTKAGVMRAKFPLMVVFNGAYFVFTVVRSKNRHYFWFYLIDDDFYPESRKFHAELDLLATSPSVPVKKSEGKEMIYSSEYSMDYLFKSGKLHSVGDEELGKYTKDNHFEFEFIIKEVPKSFEEDSSYSSSDSSEEESTQFQSQEEKDGVDPETVVGDQNPLYENAKIENEPNANAVEETALQSGDEQSQPKKADAPKIPLKSVEKNINQPEDLVASQQKLEVLKSFKQDSSSSSSDSSEEENTQSQSQDSKKEKNGIEAEKIVEHQNPLDKNAEIENEPISTASGSMFEETELQSGDEQNQPEKADELKNSLENVEKNENSPQELAASQQELVIIDLKIQENESPKIDGGVDSKGSSSGLPGANLVSVECPKCLNEIFSITTRGRVTVTPILDQHAPKSRFSNHK